MELMNDGTLSVKVEDATQVTRVLVEDGKSGDLYYADGGEYEWCHDCKEYDTKKHCCPRWNKVIRQTVAGLEADRPQGEWIAKTENCQSYWVCSECGTWALLDYHEQMCLSNYCPNCGAHMKGADDEESV